MVVGLVGVASTPGAILTGPERAATAVLLLAGWVGLTVLGSLLHLLTVLRRVRSLPRPSPPSAREFDRYLPPMALLGVALLAAAQFVGLAVLAAPGAVALLAVYAFVGARTLRLVVAAVRAAPLRI